MFDRDGVPTPSHTPSVPGRQLPLSFPRTRYEPGPVTSELVRSRAENASDGHLSPSFVRTFRPTRNRLDRFGESSKQRT